ncbi:MAG: COG1361 S-layer family protein [Candidatus Woesearchaeota archaeon]
MKTVIAIVMFLVLAVGASAAGGPMVKASILRYVPAPAEQGNTVDVWISLNNEGTTAKNVIVKFLPEYPFSLPQGQKGEIVAGSVAQTESKVIKFTVFVDQNAPNGDSNIKFLYSVDNGQWIQLEAPVALQTQDAVLVVDEYQVVPSPIVPGQIVDVKLKLRNAGRIAVKNVDASIDLADGKFSTIGMGAMQRIAYIGAGETEEITFKLASDTSTEVKVYNVPVALSYQDERNKILGSTARISLVVNAKPELSLTVDGMKFDDKKKPGTVSLKVVNKGVADLKYLTVVLVQTDQYDILSPSNEAYVGNLDNDDFETVDFIIKPLVDSPRLSIKLEFKDPYNVDFSQQYDLPLRIITAKELGQKKFPVGTVVIVLFIIGIILYWWFKRRKKR